mgnify:CR=1 FL=1
MTDFNKLIGSLASSGAVSGFAGGLAGGALGGALTSKKGRKLAGSALKYGAVAAVGGIAYSAYKRYQQNTPSADTSTSHNWSGIGQERFAAAIENANGSGALLIMRAMIAAAFADGHLDDQEKARIFAELDRRQLSPTDKASLFDELKHPLSMSKIVEEVGSPEIAAEVYAASLIAIDETSPDGQLYLRTLASALSIPEELTTSIYEQVELSRNEGQAA